MKTSEPRLGVDFGRVIHGGVTDSGQEDTGFLGVSIAEALRSAATTGAFDALPRLVERFDRRVWIISKCGESTEEKTRRWLDHHHFYERTGLPRGNVRFCRKRADKAIHCTELGITHMIDDRLDVHRAIRDVVPNRYLFGPQDQPVPEWVIHAMDWATVDRLITAGLATRRS